MIEMLEVLKRRKVILRDEDFWEDEEMIEGEREIEYVDSKGRRWIGYEFFEEKMYRNFREFFSRASRIWKKWTGETLKNEIDSKCIGKPKFTTYGDYETEYEILIHTGRSYCNEGDDTYALGWDLEFEGKLPVEKDKDIPEEGWGRIYLYYRWVED